jgi:hypothetical protein
MISMTWEWELRISQSLRVAYCSAKRGDLYLFGGESGKVDCGGSRKDS